MSEHATLTDSPDGAPAGAAVAPSPRAGLRRGRRRPASTPHTPRFRVALVVMTGVAVAAVAVAVLVGIQGRGGSSAPSPQWSPWSPPDSGNQGARDIADYVGPLYRATPADQLDVITVVNLESAAAASASEQAQANGTSTATQSGLQVAVRPSTTSSQVSLLNGNTIAYNLCGIGGHNCAIGVGQASTDRLLLLRREALELALYTFRYIHGTQNVVAILPPGHTVSPTTSTLSKKPPTADGTSRTKPIDIALLFVREELSPFLKQPLANILPEVQTPTVSQMGSAPEAELVSEVTARGLFSEQLQQTQDGSSLIVLDPLPAQ